MKPFFLPWFFASAFSSLLPLGVAAQATDHTIPAPTFYRTVEVDGLNIFYREAGPKDAPAILLLQGFPTSSRMFRNLIPALADRYRGLAPAYPGCGHNSMPPRDEFAYTFDNLAGVEEFTAMLGRRHSVRVSLSNK